MQLHQTLLQCMLNDLVPTGKSTSIPKNWTNTVANITGLATGLTVYAMGAAFIINSALKHSDSLCCPSAYCQDNALKLMLGNAVLSLTVGVWAGRVTQLALRRLQTPPQIENKIPTEQKA